MMTVAVLCPLTLDLVVVVALVVALRGDGKKHGKPECRLEAVSGLPLFSKSNEKCQGADVVFFVRWRS